MTLPTEATKRKEFPIATGVVDYFPDALAAVAEVSFVGNEQHNPGSPLHWDRSKSTDEADAMMRHFVQRGTFDSDGMRHSAKAAWRMLALLQKEIEGDNGLELRPGARVRLIGPAHNLAAETSHLIGKEATVRELIHYGKPDNIVYFRANPALGDWVWCFWTPDALEVIA